MMRRLLPLGIVGSLVILLGALVFAGSPGAAQDLDFDIAGGHFYKQTNGKGGAGDDGYAITNAAGIQKMVQIEMSRLRRHTGTTWITFSVMSPRQVESWSGG